MRKCILFVNNSNSCTGIYNDVVRWLAVRGFKPSAIVLVSLARDNAIAFSKLDPDLGLPCNLSHIVVTHRAVCETVLEPEAEDEDTLRVYVVNGGVTEQAWWMAKELARHEVAKERLSNSASRQPGDPTKPAPRLFLNVQKDGVQVMLDGSGYPEFA